MRSAATAPSSCPKPSNISASARDKRIVLSWSTIQGANGFQYPIKSSSDAYGTWRLPGIIDIDTATASITKIIVDNNGVPQDVDLTNGITYTLQLRGRRTSTGLSVRGGRQFFMVQVAVTGWGSRYRSGTAPSWRDSPGGQRPSLPGQHSGPPMNKSFSVYIIISTYTCRHIITI